MGKPNLTTQQINDLAISKQRVDAGTPGVATENNAGDIANRAFAQSHFGLSDSNLENIDKIAAIGTGAPTVGGAPIVENNDVSEGTDEQRTNFQNNQNTLNNTIGGVTDTQESTQNVIDRLTREREQINTTSSEQEKRITEAGKRAGASFDATLEEAQHSRQQTLPQDIIRGGERGGFESTQMAGQAALLPTQGAKGESFVGVGGLFDESRQAMDRNISLIKAKQLEAIAAAEAAEREYIQSNKKEDYDATLALVKLANDMENDKETIAINRDRLLFDQEKFDTTESRLGASTQADLDTKAYNIMKDILAGETQTINGKEYKGIAINEIEPFYTSATIASLMKEVKVGETRKIKDLNTGDMITIEGFKVEDNGNMTHKDVNQNTGKITFTTVDKNGDPVNQFSTGGGATFKASSGGGKSDNDRLLTLSEQKEYEMPVGTTLQEAIDSGAAPKEKELSTKEIIEDRITNIIGGDKKLDTQKYEDLRNDVINQEPSLLKWFDDTYNPKAWLDENDPKGAELIENYRVSQYSQ